MRNTTNNILERRLIEAIDKSNIEAIRLFLEALKDEQQLLESNNYFLFSYAAGWGHIDICKLLLQFCQPEKIPEMLLNAFGTAIEGGHPNILELLLANCSADSKDKAWLSIQQQFKKGHSLYDRDSLNTNFLIKVVEQGNKVLLWQFLQNKEIVSNIPITTIVTAALNKASINTAKMLLAVLPKSEGDNIIRQIDVNSLKHTDVHNLLHYTYTPCQTITLADRLLSFTKFIAPFQIIAGNWFHSYQPDKHRAVVEYYNYFQSHFKSTFLYTPQLLEYETACAFILPWFRITKSPIEEWLRLPTELICSILWNLSPYINIPNGIVLVAYEVIHNAYYNSTGLDRQLTYYEGLKQHCEARSCRHIAQRE